MAKTKTPINITKRQFEQWLTDLRSGKFRRGYGRLKYHVLGETSYCCLGVLANRLVTSKNQEKRGSSQVELFTFRFNQYGGVYSQTGLPKELLSQSAQNKLVKMNDIKQRSFGEIADWIERNLKPVRPTRKRG